MYLSDALVSCSRWQQPIPGELTQPPAGVAQDGTQLVPLGSHLCQEQLGSVPPNVQHQVCQGGVQREEAVPVGRQAVEV